MTSMSMIIAFLSGLLTHVALDAVWLGRVARDVYKRKLHDLMAPKIRWGAALIFYIVYGAGVVWFAVAPAVASGDAFQALVSGAFLGLVAYGTYDLTNLATLRGWPMVITLLDLAWGTVASALSAFVAAIVVLSL